MNCRLAGSVRKLTHLFFFLSLSWWLTNRNPELRKLIRIHHRRRIRHQVGAALSFRESHHVANRTDTAKKCCQSFHAERQSAMRRSSVLKSVDEETKLRLRLFWRETEKLEH